MSANRVRISRPAIRRDLNHTGDMLGHGVFVATAQSGGCPDAAAFGQATDDLDDFGFVQTQADEPPLLVEGFAARRIEATEALHKAGTGFESANFLV